MLHFFCENIICSGIFAGFRKEYYGISVITQKSHVITYVFQMIRHLLNFYHFSAFRQGDDIYIHHGFSESRIISFPPPGFRPCVLYSLPLPGSPAAAKPGLSVWESETTEKNWPSFLCAGKKRRFMNSSGSFCRNFPYPP